MGEMTPGRERRKRINIAKKNFAALCDMFNRQTEVSKILGLQKILKVFRDEKEQPPGELLFLLAALLSGRTDVQPKYVKKERKKRRKQHDDK